MNVPRTRVNLYSVAASGGDEDPVFCRLRHIDGGVGVINVHR
jgi:hypothetical protein